MELGKNNQNLKSAPVRWLLGRPSAPQGLKRSATMAAIMNISASFGSLRLGLEQLQASLEPLGSDSEVEVEMFDYLRERSQETLEFAEEHLSSIVAKIVEAKSKL